MLDLGVPGNCRGGYEGLILIGRYPEGVPARVVLGTQRSALGRLCVNLGGGLLRELKGIGCERRVDEDVGTALRVQGLAGDRQLDPVGNCKELPSGEDQSP